MEIGEFQASLKADGPPPGLTPALEALWWDAKGNWEKAHDSAQRDEGPDGSWVHGYLHRRQGDLSNAKYWYRRADRATGYGDLQREWESILAWLIRAAG